MASVASCFCLAKDAGFKVVVHMMPDLPAVGWERDMECFREFFENPAFRTDGLKLYPTLVIRGGCMAVAVIRGGCTAVAVIRGGCTAVAVMRGGCLPAPPPPPVGVPPPPSINPASPCPPPLPQYTLAPPVPPPLQARACMSSGSVGCTAPPPPCRHGPV